MKNTLIKFVRSTCAAAAVTLSAFTAMPVEAQSPAPIYSVIATWIGDHDYILPYRKDALPFILKQGASWTHLYFPDSFYEEGFSLEETPDELHIMRFNDLAQMQAIFSSPEYTEPADKYFDKAFSNTLGFPAAGEAPTKGQNGNYQNYFVTAFVDLKAPDEAASFSAKLKKAASHSGLQETSQLSFMMPPGSGAPAIALLASFESKEAFETFMEKTGRIFFSDNTTRYALIGGYDTKKS